MFFTLVYCRLQVSHFLMLSLHGVQLAPQILRLWYSYGIFNFNFQGVQSLMPRMTTSWHLSCWPQRMSAKRYSWWLLVCNVETFFKIHAYLSVWIRGAKTWLLSWDVCPNLYIGMYSKHLQVIKLLLMKLDEHMKSDVSSTVNEIDTIPRLSRNSDPIRLCNWALQYECPALFEVCMLCILYM